MHVITRRWLQAFWSLHPDAEGPLRAWLAAIRADWMENDRPMITLFHSQGGFSFIAREASDIFVVSLSFTQFSMRVYISCW